MKKKQKLIGSILPKTATPCVMVIFGIAGDLTKRLLYPAICNLGSKGLLDKKFCIIGISMEKYTTETFREYLIHNIKSFVTEPAAQKFGLSLVNQVEYISGSFDDAQVYLTLKNKLEALQVERALQNHLFYLATPPDWVAIIASELHKLQLLLEEKNQYRRLIVEKPFGHDLASAKSLNQQLLSVLNESQIFRIDHFLGKETVQNLLAFRFSNGIFEPLWNRRYIDHIQITAAEVLGVELRGAYYEHAGALRDMVPNHLFQLLSLIAMEPPVSFSAEYVRDEKSKALRAVQMLTPEQVLQQTVRGQYGIGNLDDIEVPAYRSENNVSPQSSTETYVALKLFLNNWRWLDVPFYLRTGKRMKARTSEIIVQFKSEPAILMGGATGQKALPNILRIKIQPDEGISLSFNAKVPGPAMELGQVDMSFKYSDYFGIEPQTGYETVLYDCMKGDQTLFKRAEMVETGWALVQPILDVWGALTPREFPNYAAGTWGPVEADKLLQKDGREWLL